jgi:hypothetical protein
MPTNNSMKQNWYLIYDILFPDQPPPESPYVESLLSGTLSSFRNFLASDGSELVTQCVRLSTLDSPSSHEEEIAARATIFRDCIMNIVQRFQEQNDTKCSQSCSSDSSGSSPPAMKAMETGNIVEAGSVMEGSSASAIEFQHSDLEQLPGLDQSDSTTSESGGDSISRHHSSDNWPANFPGTEPWTEEELEEMMPGWSSLIDFDGNSGAKSDKTDCQAYGTDVPLSHLGDQSL